jgi:hypothetical protein
MLGREDGLKPEVLSAIKAMQKCVEGAGEDLASRAAAEVLSWGRKERWAEIYGLKESGGRLCVQRLLGKNCIRYNMRDSFCDCQPPGADHASLWLKHGKPHVYVMQPYPMQQESWERLFAFCKKYGLQADIDTWPAWHFPGRVHHINIMREGEFLQQIAEKHEPRLTVH